MKANVTILTIAIIFMIVGGVIADVPSQINFQGALTDSVGNPIDDNRQMTFAIYADSIGGSSLWSETHTSVDVTDGLFHVVLGSVTGLPASIFDDEILWLETIVEADILAPRTKMVTVPYGFKSNTADQATYADTANVALETQSISYVDTADYAHEAGYAYEADYAYYADEASYSTEAENATYADTAQYAAMSMPDADWTVNADTIYHLNGNVGIGTATPAEKLEVDGTVKMTGFQLTGTRSAGDVLTSDANGVGTWQAPTGGSGFSLPYEDSVSTVGYAFSVRNDYSPNGVAIQGEHGPSGNFGCLGYYNRGVYGNSHNGQAVSGSTSGSGFSGYFHGKFYASGNVGIGTETPTEMLDVNGTAKLTGFKMPTGASDGYVLTSDGSGTGTWQEAAGGLTLPFYDSVAVAGFAFEINNGGSYGGASAIRGKHGFSGNYGDLGTSMYALYGFHSSGNFGYIGHSDKAVYGSSVNGRAIEGFSTNGYAGYFTGDTHISGDLGIGTTTPACRLHVYEPSGTTTLRVESDDGAPNLMLVGTDNSGYSGMQIWEDNDLKLAMGWHFTNDYFYIQEGYSNVLYLKDGDFGLGTYSPETKLHVNGDLTVDEIIIADDAGGLRFATDDGISRMHMADDGSLKLGTNGSYFFEIKEVIDTTSTSGDYTYLWLPSGYDWTNTHVLSMMIWDGSNTWICPGHPDTDYSYSCVLNGNAIIIDHPDNSYFHDHPVKALVMKMP